MERYLGGEEIDADGADRGPGEGGRPRLVLPGGPGVQQHRRRHARAARGRRPAAFPSPLEHPLPEVFTPQGKARDGADAATRTARWWPRWSRRRRDPYVGRVSLVRVFSGTLRPDATVHVSGHFTSFFGARARRPRGPRRGRADRRAVVPARQDAAAGAAGGRRRHLRDRPAEPRRDRRHPVRQGRPAACCEPWTMPEPLLPVAIAAARQGRRGQAVGQGCSGWPPRTRRCGSSTTPRPTRSCCGAWARRTPTCVLDRLANRYGVARRHRSTCGCRCARRSAAPAKGHGRHVKQSGGHGQYAVCDIEVEPLPEGAGFEFVDKVVGGAVPRQFIPVGREGRARPDGARRRRRLPGGRHPGHADRRQGAQRRLLRHGVPDGRRRWRCARRPRRPG